MDIYAILGITSGVMAAASFIPYIGGILRNETKPQPITWFLWAFMGIITVGTYWSLGARDTIWIAVVNFLGPLIISILTLRHWDWKQRFSVFDYACLGFSILSIAIWLNTNNPALALTFNLMADLIAALPTLRKVYKYPSSENTTAWLVLVAANTLSLLAIEQWSYGVALLPAYLFCLSSAVTLLSLRKAGNSSIDKI